MKLPSYQFYPGDWMKDPGLRSVGYAARGLWIDMLSLMFENDRRGYLQVNGKPVTAELLARMTGGSTDEVSRLLQELTTSGVSSSTEDGTPYCRRMVRDEQKREQTRVRVQRYRAVTPMKRGCTEDEDETALPQRTQRITEPLHGATLKTKEFHPDDLVFMVLRELRISARNPELTVLVSDALRMKGGEPDWTAEKAALHFIERGTAYQVSAVWNTEYKKSWSNWFKDQCYDQDPKAWNRQAKHVTDTGQTIGQGYIPRKKKN